MKGERTMDTLKAGTIVKFSRPVDDDEAAERFVVLEDREHSVLVTSAGDFFKGWEIKPTFAYPRSELELTHA